MIEELEVALPPLAPDLPERPWWISRIVANRELWQDTALSDDSDGTGRIFLFLYAKMVPYEACFLELRLVPLLWPELPGERFDEVPFIPENWHEYDILDPMRTMRDTDLPFAEDADILVHEGLRFHGHRVIAPHAPRPFEDFVRYHPRRPMSAPRRSSAPRTKLTSTTEDLILERCPWLERDDLREWMPVAKRARHRGDDAASRPAKEGDDAADATDKDCDDDLSLLGGDDEAAGSGDVARDLADVREELAVLEDSTEPYYKVNIRGGKWTIEHKKEVADCAQAVPRDAETRYWSIAYELPSSKSFSFRLYGRDSALALAREFCRRAICWRVCTLILWTMILLTHQITSPVAAMTWTL